MQYDFIIENGTTIDGARRIHQKETIYIAAGRIAPPPPPGESVDAIQRIDAEGKWVLPGFIDEHCHLNYDGSNIGANADILCPASGVTTAVDAGTSGYANYELFHKATLVRATTDILAYLHLSPYGVHSSCLHEENHDPRDFNQQRIMALFEKYPDQLRGLKIRLSKATTSGLGLAPLERACDIAAQLQAQGFHCPVVTHYSDLPEEISVADIVQVLRPGDILAHVFQNHGETVFDDQMRIKDCLWQAREKGVLFDNCQGRIHWSFAGLQAAIHQGFLPDLISSDVIRESTFIYPGFSLLHAMNACYAAGMELVDIFTRVTVNAAHALGKSQKLGSLAIGRTADVVVVDIMEHSSTLRDRFGGEHTSSQLIVPLLTLRNGEIVFRQMFF